MRLSSDCCAEPVLVCISAVLFAFGWWIYPVSFLVNYEYSILSPPGSATGYWIESALPSAPGCVVHSANAVLFIGITNLRPHRTLITRLKVEASGKEISRLDTRWSRVFFVRPKANSNTQSPCPVGNMTNFSSSTGQAVLVNFPTKNSDLSNACQVGGYFLDKEFGEYLAPGQSIRGWAFFDAPSGFSMLHTEVTITDNSNQSFTYSVDANEGDPNGDTLPRQMIIGNKADLSSCKRPDQ
jgi:hypothetical protein